MIMISVIFAIYKKVYVNLFPVSVVVIAAEPKLFAFSNAGAPFDSMRSLVERLTDEWWRGGNVIVKQ